MSSSASSRVEGNRLLHQNVNAGSHQSRSNIEWWTVARRQKQRQRVRAGRQIAERFAAKLTREAWACVAFGIHNGEQLHAFALLL